MARRKKEEIKLTPKVIEAAVTGATEVDGVQIEHVTVANIYTDFWAKNPIEGETTLTWEVLPESDKTNYVAALAHVMDGNEPRTAFEKFAAKSL